MQTLKNYLNSGFDLLTSDNVDVKHLDSELQSKMIEFVKLCNCYNGALYKGIKIVIVQGFRSIEYQNGLYAVGRTKPGRVVSNCKGGQSPHNYGNAFDFAPLESNNTINWNTLLNLKWRVCIKLAQSIGLRSGSNFRIVDMDHLELPGSSEKAYETWLNNQKAS